MMQTKLTPDQLLYYLFCGAFFVMPFGTTPFTVLGLCILLVWFVTGQFFKARNQYMRGAWFWPVAAMVVLTWLGLIWSADPGGLGLKYAKKTHYWLYALALGGMGLSGKSSAHLMKAFFGGLGINAFVAFLQAAGLVPTFAVFGERYYTGLHSGYNTLAILLILGMLTASFYFRRAEGYKPRLAYGCIMVIYFVHLILLASRGAYVTFLVLSPVLVVNILHGRKIRFMLLAYLFVIGLMFSSPVVRDRVSFSVKAVQSHLKEGGEFASGKKYSYHIDRIYMWRWAIDLFLEHPVLGVGTGGYYKAILSKGGDAGIAHPHNIMLYVAVSWGIIGILVCGWFFWVLLKAGWQHRDHIFGFFILSSVLVILVGGMSNTHILDSGGAFLLALTTGLASALPMLKPESASMGTEA